MKIALLTYFSVNNTGQFYQALATIEALKTIFPQASIEMVNIHHERRPSWMPDRSFASFFPSLKRIILYTSARQKHFSSVLGKKRFTRPSGIELQEYLNRSGFDVVITGADTCLKVDKHWNGLLPPYWIPVGVEARKYFIAGSAENTVADNLSTEQKEEAHACLLDLSGIHVRDNMTSNLCTTIAPEIAGKVDIVGDPTFTLELPSAPLPAIRQRLGKTGKPICAINLPRSEVSSAIVRELSKTQDVFSLNRASHTGEPSFYLGPSQWLRMWNSIDAIVTSSFHETIFAMRSNVPFVTIDISKGRAAVEGVRSKASDLLICGGLDSLFLSMPTLGQASQISLLQERSRNLAGSIQITNYCDTLKNSYIKALQAVG